MGRFSLAQITFPVLFSTRIPQAPACSSAFSPSSESVYLPSSERVRAAATASACCHPLELSPWFQVITARNIRFSRIPRKIEIIKIEQNLRISFMVLFISYSFTISLYPRPFTVISDTGLEGFSSIFSRIRRIWAIREFS